MKSKWRIFSTFPEKYPPQLLAAYDVCIWGFFFLIVSGSVVWGGQLWLGGAKTEAVELYDAALHIARAAGDTANEAKVLVGKGVALLQMSGGAGPAEAADVDVGLREGGLNALRQARALSGENTPQTRFIDFLVEKSGAIPVSGAEGEQCDHNNEHGVLASQAIKTQKQTR